MSNPPLPNDTLTAAILVLVYSFLCLFLTILLFTMLQRHGERWNYISLIALTTSISTTASIMQQFYFIPNWHSVKTTEFHQAKLSQEYPSIALGPLSAGFNLALYWVQMYCYNVTSLLILCWAIALVKGVYNFRLGALALYQPQIVVASKISAALLPAIFVGVPFAPALQKRAVASLIISCAPMMFCFSIGSICVIFILFKYVRSRALFASLQGSQSNPMSAGTVQTTASPATLSGGRKAAQPQGAIIRIDKWLLLRFVICFLILSAFEVTVVIFEWTRYTNSELLASATAPDYSASSVRSAITQFIPGVTCGLLAFLIFGTTGPFRRIYLQNWRKCIPQRRRKRPSFDDRPPTIGGGLGVGGKGAGAMGRAGGRPGGGWRDLEREAGGLHGPSPSYSCTVRGGVDADSIELTNAEPLGKSQESGKGILVVQEQEQEREDSDGGGGRSWPSEGFGRQ